MTTECCAPIIDSFCAVKDPQEILDYTIDWSGVLNASDPPDSIVTSTWAISPLINGVDLNIDSESETLDHTTVWLSGGGKLNSIHRVINTITTAGGRQYERVIRLWIQNK